MCQMSVDKRFYQYVSVNPEIDNAKLINILKIIVTMMKFLLVELDIISRFLNFASTKRGTAI